MKPNATSSPKVSVAMIAFNKEKEIGDAIKGVVRQRADFPIELVIVDDVSTDGTYEVARSWQQRYPDIVRLYRNDTNKGLQGNYLEAFAHCTGEYLAICDADDYWICRDKLAVQTAYMDAHRECAVTFHRVVNLYEEDRTMSLSNGGQKADTDIRDLSRSNYITNLSVMYRRALVDLKALPDWILDDRSPDYAMHMFYAAHGTIHYFNRPMGLYRIGRQGAWSMTERYRKLEMSLTVRRNLIRHFHDRSEVVEGLKEAERMILLSMYAAAGDDKDRRAWVHAQLREYPRYVSAETVEADVRALTARRPDLKKRVLSRCRALVSRLLPVPKP